MNRMTSLSNSSFPAPVRAILISMLVIGVYFLQGEYGWALYRAVAVDLEPGWPRLLARAILTYGLGTILLPILVAIVVVGPHKCFDALGLNGSVWTAAKVGLISTAILPIAYALTAPLSSGNIVQDIFSGAILPGIGEEVFYRAMLFGLLFRFAGWGFFPAALLGATVFGIGHFYGVALIVLYVIRLDSPIPQFIYGFLLFHPHHNFVGSHHC